MKLLIITQKVDRNDDILGFFHGWIKEFAKHAEQVMVVALGVGVYDLPDNVRVFSLGKEEGVSRAEYLWRFFRIVWRERKEYDAVFVHMNPIYVVLSGVLWRALGKKVGLWYTHKHVDIKLRIAEILTDIIFTASRESFRLGSSKIAVMGHGIDCEMFKPVKHKKKDTFYITTIGRISRVKDCQMLVRVAELLVLDGVPVKVIFVGGPATSADKEYLQELLGFVREKKLEQVVQFAGAVPNRDINSYLEQTDVFVNTSNTGGLDKAVLEAMACGVPVVTSNETFSAVLGGDARTLMFPTGNPTECALCIKRVYLLADDAREALGARLRAIVEKEHNVKVLVPRIISAFTNDQEK